MPRPVVHANADNDAEAANPQAEMGDYVKAYIDKGNVSLAITSVFMLLGFILVNGPDNPKDITYEKYVLSFGLFGFAGGFTNWLAVTMLFVRIPGLAGSGVIPVRYVEIRATVKDVIMNTFFDAEFLETYLGQKLQSYGGEVDVNKHVQGMLDSEDFDKKLDEKLELIGLLPEFGAVLAMGMQPAQLKPMIKPFVSELALELAPLLKAKMLDPKVIVDINQVRDQIEEYMSVRIETLTEKKVTRLLAFVIRDHLGWLIVWGNVFGALIGLIAEAAEINPKYRDY